MPVQTGGTGGNTGVLPAARPIVTVVHVQPRTACAARTRIKIAWQSNNYNDGNIFWGPASAPAAFRAQHQAGRRGL